MMKSHAHIRALLYEYVQGELREQDHRDVEHHLQTCRRCGDAADDVRAALGLLPRPSSAPAEECPPEFWQIMISAVEQSILSNNPKRPSFFRKFIEEISTLPVFQPRAAIALGVGLVLIAAGIVSWELTRSRPSDQDNVTTTATSAEPHEIARPLDIDTRVQDYLRRSKVLLVGLANMKTANSASVDLSTEQRASRELVHEARYLAQQPLDERSARLINDLKKIQIELSNVDERGTIPDVELIQQGIQRENLLFKVRIAETLYERANVMRTRHER